MERPISDVASVNDIFTFVRHEALGMEIACIQMTFVRKPKCGDLFS